jgi:hypothetical protein
VCIVNAQCMPIQQGTGCSTFCTAAGTACVSELGGASCILATCCPTCPE